MTPPLILASRSAARAALLRQARVPFETQPAAVDEAAVKASMQAEGAPPRDIADALAELKAHRVANRAPERCVLGADQVLVCDGAMLDKPRDLAEARTQLEALRGRSHELLSAAVVFEAGRPVWRHVGRARLAMRPFSDAFLDAYLAEQGEAVLDLRRRLQARGRGSAALRPRRGRLLRRARPAAPGAARLSQDARDMPGVTPARPPLAGVLGWPIGHSKSPRLHGHWLRRHGIAGYYVPIALAPEDFEAGFRALPRLGFRGVNVTIPHKERALALATEISERAARDRRGEHRQLRAGRRGACRQHRRLRLRRKPAPVGARLDGGRRPGAGARGRRVVAGGAGGAAGGRRAGDPARQPHPQPAPRRWRSISAPGSSPSTGRRRAKPRRARRSS